jgi:hypothetical protein
MEQVELMSETAWGLEVVMKKDITIDNSSVLEIIKHIISKCKEIDKKRILITATTTLIKVSFMQLFNGVELIQKLNGAGFRIAIIVSYIPNNENSKFVETVGVNRAIFIQYFIDKDSAVEWLSE